VLGSTVGITGANPTASKRADRHSPSLMPSAELFPAGRKLFRIVGAAVSPVNEMHRQGGVIRNRIPFERPVIPAKAGIQSARAAFPVAREIDSRFRGNDIEQRE
jgi:hypothetical protein